MSEITYSVLSGTFDFSTSASHITDKTHRTLVVMSEGREFSGSWGGTPVIFSKYCHDLTGDRFVALSLKSCVPLLLITHFFAHRVGQYFAKSVYDLYVL